MSKWVLRVVMKQDRALRVGLLVNPLAGIGGSVALKGSDGPDIVAEALSRGAVPQSSDKAARAMTALRHSGLPVELYCWGGDMGERSARAAGFTPQVMGHSAQASSAEDTRAAASALAARVDLLVFAGGDGTARDIVDAVGHQIPVLGIPAGCKMHSAVYAVSPEAAGELLSKLTEGGLVSVTERDVRDIDEQAFRNGQVKSRWYGSLRVPEEDRLIQRMKSGSGDDDRLQVVELAAWVAGQLEPDTTYLVGSGSTLGAVMTALGLPYTLLGVDVIRGGQRVAADVTARQLLAFVQSAQPVQALVSVIGGQGHLFGRGNQQFSPDVIQALGRSNFRVLATRAKLKGLEGRPLLVDTGDPALDQQLCGWWPVWVGYQEELLYRVGLIQA